MSKRGEALAKTMKANVLKARSWKKRSLNRSHRKVKQKGRDLMEIYFNDIDSGELLNREQELSLAKKIHENDVEAWKIVVQNEEAKAAAASGMVPRKGTRDVGYPKRKKGWTIEDEATALRWIDTDRIHLKRAIAALPPEQRQLAERHYHASSAVREALTSGNLRLVMSMAVRFKGMGIDLNDLVQEGNLGLMTAVGKFDYQRGLRFSTYACWWIRHALGRSISEHSRTVRVPVHLLDNITKATKYKRILTGQLGRAPTDEEISAASGLSIAKLETVNKTQLEMWTLSLDAEMPGSEDGGSPMHEFMADDRVDEVDTILSTLELQKRAQDLMSKLTPIELDVLKQRFGMDDNGDGQTLKEIGEKYGVSRERIRQIQSAATYKMKKYMRKTVEEVESL